MDCFDFSTLVERKKLIPISLVVTKYVFSSSFFGYFKVMV